MVRCSFCTVLCAGHVTDSPESFPHMVFAALIILSYMLLLAGLAVAAPGIGWGGFLIELVPENWRDAAHVPVYGLLAWMVMWGLLRRGWPVRHAVSIGVLATGVFGLWTEVAQGMAPERDTSLDDVWKNLLGGMISAALVLGRERAMSFPKALTAGQKTNRQQL